MSSGENIFFTGGVSIAGAANDSIDMFNTIDATRTSAALSTARCDLSAATSGDYVLFAGGYDTSSYSDVVDLFKLDTGQWTTSQLSQPRSKLVAIAAIDGFNLLFAGGESGEGMSDVMDIFNASSLQWYTTTPLSVGRKSLAAARTSEQVIIAGGELNTRYSGAIDYVNVTACASSSSSLSSSISSSAGSGSVSSGMLSSSTGGSSASSQSQSQSQSSTSGSGSSGQSSASGSTSTPSGSSTENGGCISSSAVKGTKIESKLWKIRKFKDEKLNKHLIGRTHISIYYPISPMGTYLVERSTLVKYAMRNVLISTLGLL